MPKSSFELNQKAAVNVTKREVTAKVQLHQYQNLVLKKERQKEIKQKKSKTKSRRKLKVKSRRKLKVNKG
jgi:hypothetical protein